MIMRNMVFILGATSTFPSLAIGDENYDKFPPDEIIMHTVQ